MVDFYNMLTSPNCVFFCVFLCFFAGVMDPPSQSADGGRVPLSQRLHSLHVLLAGWGRQLEESTLCKWVQRSIIDATP